MRKTKNNKILLFIMFALFFTMLINNILTTQSYANVTVGSNVHLYGEKDLVSVLQIKSTGGLKQVTKVYYINPETGGKLYAFCIEPSKPRNRNRSNR